MKLLGPVKEVYFCWMDRLCRQKTCELYWSLLIYISPIQHTFIVVERVIDIRNIATNKVEMASALTNFMRY